MARIGVMRALSRKVIQSGVIMLVMKRKGESTPPPRLITIAPR
jgi:hypothetical protein